MSRLEELTQKFIARATAVWPAETTAEEDFADQRYGLRKVVVNFQKETGVRSNPYLRCHLRYQGNWDNTQIILHAAKVMAQKFLDIEKLLQEIEGGT